MSIQHLEISPTEPGPRLLRFNLVSLSLEIFIQMLFFPISVPQFFCPLLMLPLQLFSAVALPY